MSKKVLLAGESWMSYTTHVKGFDSFYTSTYETGEKWLKAALEAGGYEVTFLPNHLANEEFPFTMEELKQYDLVILSDIGANTPLLMVGGYLTFSGVDAKGKWHDTAVQEVLPVEVLTVDDRMEHCEGVKPVTVGEHEALKGIPTDWPEVLGYNKVIAKPEAEVPVTVEGDPFIAFASYGKGRSGVVTTDCAPHWAPPEFCEWEYYNKLWQNIADWLIQK